MIVTFQYSDHEIYDEEVQQKLIVRLAANQNGLYMSNAQAPGQSAPQNFDVMIVIDQAGHLAFC